MLLMAWTASIETRPGMTNTMVKCLAISIAIHFTVFGVWAIGQTAAWKKFVARFPSLKLAQKPKPPAVKPPTVQSQQQMQLTFIEVDPSQIAKEAPNAKVTIGRELTKLHEEVITGTPAELAASLEKRKAARGEFVVIIEP